MTGPSATTCRPCSSATATRSRRSATRCSVEEEVRTGGYHLIILDLMMPKLDGIEVLRRIRKLDTDIAVVIFTGFPNLESAVPR